MVKQKKAGFFKSREDLVSMFLGLVVVVAVVGFLVNFIEKRKGNVDIPGVSSYLKIDDETKIEKEERTNKVTVEENDSLWKIAVRKYNDGYKWTEIAKANNLTNPNYIYTGQELVLPQIEKNDAQVSVENDKTITSEPVEYKVVMGDSLWKIATRVYGDGNKWTKIWDDNRSKLNSPDKLEIGMMLKVYGKI